MTVLFLMIESFVLKRNWKMCSRTDMQTHATQPAPRTELGRRSLIKNIINVLLKCAIRMCY